jgi:hypothetical protein
MKTDRFMTEDDLSKFVVNRCDSSPLEIEREGIRPRGNSDTTINDYELADPFFSPKGLAYFAQYALNGGDDEKGSVNSSEANSRTSSFMIFRVRTNQVLADLGASFDSFNAKCEDD